MSRLRKLIIAFWIFIGCMLLWQFYEYDQGLTQAEEAHPTQEHFFFYQTNLAPVAPPPQRHDGAYVEQTSFTTRDNTPATGSFTCQVTLKNDGNAKAVGVQVMVRPYRGIRTGDEDMGHTPLGVLSDNDPLAQLGQWVTFPDLAPGESSTQSVVFLSHPDVQPGANPNPDLVFQTDKSQPQAHPHQPAN